MSVEPVFIDGSWREAAASGAFTAENPAEGTPLPRAFPVSTWADCEAALASAAEAAIALRQTPPARLAEFLTGFAELIERRAEEICGVAALETGLPTAPRLREAELPRTTNQLRQAAAAAAEESWKMPTIDASNGLRACFGPLGPVAVFGPNNFPLAFNSIGGGDFAAALAAGNPVIGKANTSHPDTTRLLAQCAAEALSRSGLPRAAVQLIYRTSHADGARLVADPRLGATAYTGSRTAGLRLKAAADAAGKPIYLELSSVNPVVLLPAALAGRGAELVAEVGGSCLLGVGQFCTCPNLLLLLAGSDAEAFLEGLAARFEAQPGGVLLSRGVLDTLAETVGSLREAGADVVTGGARAARPGYAFQNTLLRVSGSRFLENPRGFQTEAFGNATLAVVADDVEQAAAIAAQIEGSLTAAIYSARDRRDDPAHARLEPALRAIAGRLLNDKMPTGVAVSPAMNHGGPYPATGHPGFTAVGIPAALRRFAMLQCYDNVREERLPDCLRTDCPNPRTWRLVDGAWTRGLGPSA